jgi:thiopeptide-type bacteriocin biosynthesis protein
MTTTTPTTWHGLHCYLYWQPDTTDSFLTETVAPHLDASAASEQIRRWFYIRYAERGPHLRIRVETTAATAAQIQTELTRLIAAHPAPEQHPAMTADTYPHGLVRDVDYVPETERYGGDEAIAIAEHVFCLSSAIAVDIIAATDRPSSRLTAATDLIIATTVALDLNRVQAAAWLRQHASSWRNTGIDLAPATAVQQRTAAVRTDRSPQLERRWHAIEQLSTHHPDPPTSPVTRWSAIVRTAHQQLLAAGATERRLRSVWASQMHMLCNRLGVSPEEERSLCWLLAGIALSPQGPEDYFQDGHLAPDRRYTEAAKYLPGRDVAHSPRPSPTTFPPRHRPDLPTIDLAAGALAPVTLAQSLRQRTTARGNPAGPLSANDLGTLLWHAYGTTGQLSTAVDGADSVPIHHRPYPSAGAQYVARLRVIVRQVSGVEPGLYQADPVRRRLVRLGKSPTLAELTATSIMFHPQVGRYTGFDLTDMPAMLVLYIETGRLRTRYGLRALRFALLEAGHLAQSLALVATAARQSLTLVGGFYDDLVHEMTGLDGVDDIAVYLMPIGMVDDQLLR